METLIYTLFSMNITITLALFGVVLRRLSAMDNRLREAPSRDEVDKTIDLKQEAIKVRARDIKEDLEEIKAAQKEIQAQLLRFLNQ